MTEYIKKSFTVRMHTPSKIKMKCARCGVELEEVIYKLNREPVCKECFKKPMRAQS